jgi:hypothetical protein
MPGSPYHFDETLAGQWIGRRGSVGCPPRSPDLPPLDFYLWRSLKDVIYRRKPPTLVRLREEIETSSGASPVDTLTAVARALVLPTQKCLKLMVGTLNTYSLSTCVAANPFCVNQIWNTNKLFKQILCNLKCVYVFWSFRIRRIINYSNTKEIHASLLLNEQSSSTSTFLSARNLKNSHGLECSWSSSVPIRPLLETYIIGLSNYILSCLFTNQVSLT